MYAGVSLDQAPPEDIPVRFFLSAPVFGIIAGLLILWDGGDLFVSNWGTSTIALTHLFTLGWLAMIMMGSFYQMVPVLVGGTVPYIMAARKVHAMFAAGVVLIVAGIYLLSEPLITIASLLLLVSLLFFVIQLGIALLKVKADRPTVLAMRISIAALLVTVLLGFFFSGGHAGFWELPDNRVQMTGIHLTLGLFGWVGSLIMGVGFHVIPMFYMTPEFPSEKSFSILLAYTSSLILLPLSLLADGGGMLSLMAGLPALAAMLVFTKIMLDLIKNRKRKIVDVTLRSWQVALVLLPLALLAFVLCQLTDHPAFIFSFGIIFIAGFGLTVTTGMLYKILPFLIWFHRFSLLIGKVPVPLMRDISPDKPAQKQIRLFWAALLLLIIGAIFESGMLVRLGGLFFATSSLLLMVNLLRMVRMKAPELPEQTT
ncbi:MAG: hypothetical protein IMF07_07225 [Proteobacteria bacterium]|nr:hypothetical protein [Pseudomonadota bacterium]